jgi:hypothetical protein
MYKLIILFLTYLSLKDFIYEKMLIDFFEKRNKMRIFEFEKI